MCGSQALYSDSEQGKDFFGPTIVTGTQLVRSCCVIRLRSSSSPPCLLYPLSRLSWCSLSPSDDCVICCIPLCPVASSVSVDVLCHGRATYARWRLRVIQLYRRHRAWNSCGRSAESVAELNQGDDPRSALAWCIRVCVER